MTLRHSLLSEVVVSVECVDVLVVAVSIWHVARTTAPSKEHRCLDVEIAPSTNQLGNGISEYAHPGFAASAEHASWRSIFCEWWQRFVGEIVDGDSLLPARYIPQILDPRSNIGERSREHRRRMVIGRRIGNRISRLCCWRRVKMCSGRMRIRVPIPPTVPTLLRSVRLCVVEIVVSVRIPPDF